jgi:predicted small secreted protein
VTARRRVAATAALAAVLLIGAPVLTGCSMVEGIIESQTGGDIDLGGNTVPDDFPSEVPLADGDVVNGSAISASGGEKVWNVLIAVSDPAAPESIAAQLEAAGFTAPGVGGVTDEGGTLTYAKDDLVVNVLLAKTGDGWTANYTVAKSAS